MRALPVIAALLVLVVLPLVAWWIEKMTGLVTGLSTVLVIIVSAVVASKVYQRLDAFIENRADS